MLVVRVAWMKEYNGIQRDDKPIAGGSGKFKHMEIYNFRKKGQKLYGYFRPINGRVNLQRIDAAADDNQDVVHNILVVFVALHPDGLGSVVVGWYGNADVYRDYERTPGIPGKFGHLCVADRKNCVLLPVAERTHVIPHAKNPQGIATLGQHGAFFPLDEDFVPRREAWLKGVARFVGRHNELGEEEIDEISPKPPREPGNGQGPGLTAEQRKIVELHAMKVAQKYFEKLGYDVDDVSGDGPFDLLCIKDFKELHVEVKGTTSLGGQVILTRNEVKHFQTTKHGRALFVLHSVTLKDGYAKGGKAKVFMRWKLRDDDLTPTHYTYLVGEPQPVDGVTGRLAG